MKVTRLLHASVNTTAAPDETARFYAEVLGLAPAARPDMPGVPGQWFTVSDAQVHLIGLAESGNDLDPTRHHVCFGVADLDVAIAHLDAHGVAHFGSAEQIFFCDPAGNVIELQHDAE